jgi:hypothetical protein
MVLKGLKTDYRCVFYSTSTMPKKASLWKKYACLRRPAIGGLGPVDAARNPAYPPTNGVKIISAQTGLPNGAELGWLLLTSLTRNGHAPKEDLSTKRLLSSFSKISEFKHTLG